MPNQKRLIIFAGRSNPDLGSKIAELLGVRLGEVILKTFANGENYCRYEESIRGCDAFLVQSPLRAGDAQRPSHGVAAHDPGRQAGVRSPGHGRYAVLPLRAARDRERRPASRSGG